MIFKIYYQPNKIISPRRENTESLYLEAKTEIEARLLVEKNTNYNIEYIEGLDDKTLDYESKNANFKLTEF